MHDDWIDLFRLLGASNVRYLVVGGYAVAFYGFERYTKDLDIWVARDRENAAAIVRALKAFGASPRSLQVRNFEDPKKVITMGLEPYRVDFITNLDALDFDVAWRDRVERSNKGVMIKYVSRDHLILLKTGTGRFVDERDIGALTPKAARKARTAKTTKRKPPRTRTRKSAVAAKKRKR